MTSNHIFRRRFNNLFTARAWLCLGPFLSLLMAAGAAAQTMPTEAGLTDGRGPEGGVVSFTYTAPADSSNNYRAGTYEITFDASGNLAATEADIRAVTGSGNPDTLGPADPPMDTQFPLVGAFVMAPGQVSYQIHVATNTDDDINDEVFSIAVTRFVSFELDVSGNPDETTFIDIPSGLAEASGNIIDRGETPLAQTGSVNQLAAPQVTSAINVAVSQAVQKHVHSAFDGGRAAGLQLQGAGLARYLKTLGHNRDGRSLRPQNASFVLTADADGEGGIGKLGAVSLWGQYYQQRLDMTSDETKFSGALRGTMFGADFFVNKNLLFGLGIVESRAALDFTQGSASGEHTTHLRGVRPYFGWRSPTTGNRVWGSAGIENGTVELRQDNPPDADANAGPIDVRTHSFTGGLYNPLYTLGDVDRAAGATRVGFSGDFAHARLRDTENESFAAESGRARMSMQYQHERGMANGGYRSGTMAMALRYDYGSAGPIGSGMEAGGGMHWRFPARGLRFQVDARTLLTHRGDLNEWGFSGAASWAATDSGEGLSLSFKPQWGDTTSDRQQLWEHGIAATQADAAAYHAWTAKYGLALAREDQALTLFIREQADRTGLGADYRLGEAFTAGYEAVARPERDTRGYIRYRREF